MTMNFLRPAVIAVALHLVAGHLTSAAATAPQVPTFASEIAPIIYRHCIECHRPGGVGPFSLVEYDAVRRRARQIAEVSGSGFMPPWLPMVGYGPELEGARGLTPEEILLLQRWHEAGAPEGDNARLAPPPEFRNDWLLGEPDLVLELPEPYVVPADGGDIIRNFVIPIPLVSTRNVRAIDIQSGNSRVLHHAFLQLDQTSSSRNRDAADPLPGFGGMELSGGFNPDGHFLGWTPGARPYESFPGTEWEIEPGTDLVLQLHLVPGGKEESIQPKVGIYYSPTARVRKPFTLLLKASDIDIAPGDAAYRVERRFTTPVPLEIVRLYPHAHYLGKTFELYAIDPDGRKQPLLYIPAWDFNWQGDYRFKEPVSLRAGATIVMAWVFENSNDNPRNPTVPAKRVQYGPGSLDEMAEVSIQTLVPEDLDRARVQAAYAGMQLREDTGNFHAYTNLALAQAQQGETELAAANYRRAIDLNPRYAPALNNLGVLHSRRGEYDRARMRFEESLRAEPDYLDARHNLATELYRSGDHLKAVQEARVVVTRNPRLAESQLLLAQALRDSGDIAGALAQLSAALQGLPDDPRLLLLAGECALLLNRPAEAQRWLEQALKLDNSNADARYRLGLSHLQRGDSATAALIFEQLLEMAPAHMHVRMRLGQIRSRQHQQEEAVNHFAAAWHSAGARQREVLLGALNHHREIGAMAEALARAGEGELARAAVARAARAAIAANDHAYARELETRSKRFILPERMR